MTLGFRKTLAVLFLVVLALTGCDRPEEKAAHFIERGNALFEQGDFVRARLEYKNAVRLTPTSAMAHFKLALAHESLGDLEEAFSSLTTAEEQDPTFRDARLKLAQYFLLSGQNTECARRLGALIEANPRDAEVLGVHALFLLATNDQDGAEKESRHALDLSPTEPSAFSALIQLYRKKGDDAQAMAIAEIAIQKNPDNFPLLLLKASLHDARGDVDGVVEIYQRLFALHPGDASLHATLAESFLRHGKIDRAENILRKAVAQFPKSTEAKELLISFLIEKRAPENVEEAVRRFMDEHPDDASFRLRLAQLLADKGRTAQAKDVLRPLVENGMTERPELTARAMMAGLHIKENNTAEAAKILEDVLKIDPNHAEALYWQASLFFDEKNYDRAALNLRLVLRDTPAATDALYLLTETFIRQNKSRLALDAIDNALNVAPSDTSILTIKARTLISLERFDEAFDILNALATAAPDNDAVANDLAQLIADTRWQDPAALEKAATLAERFATSSDPLALDTLAWVSFRQGNFTRASELMGRIIGSGSSLPAQVYYHHGMILAAQGQNDAAREALTIAAAPGQSAFLGLSEASKELERLMKAK